MPNVPRMPPGRRFYARIDRFECACPHCGRLVFAGIDKRHLPARLVQNNRARAAAKQRPRASSVLAMFWNPYTQRWACPWCDHVFTVGVVFYPVRPGGRINFPALDCDPTSAEVAEMRRLSGGWFVKGYKYPRADGNLHVTASCSCPELGTDPACPLHGERTLGGTSPGGENQ